MSWKGVAWVVEQNMAPLDKLVLLILANYASDAGKSYPSTETLARKTCMSSRSVIRALDRLIEQRWIQDTGKRTGMTKQIKVYYLPAADETDVKGANQSVLKTDNGAGKTDTQSPLRLTHSHPEPLEEPLKEPKRKQLSKFIEFLKEDQRFDGLDVEGEIERALKWCRKKNRPVTERFLESWLLHAEHPLEDDDEEEPVAWWHEWTEERMRALQELYPEATMPPLQWSNIPWDVQERIDNRVKKGWPA